MRYSPLSSAGYRRRSAPSWPWWVCTHVCALRCVCARASPAGACRVFCGCVFVRVVIAACSPCALRAQTAELQILRQRLAAVEAAPADSCCHEVAMDVPAPPPPLPSRCLPGPPVAYTLHALEERVQAVDAQLASCVDHINEALEDMRAEMEG